MFRGRNSNRRGRASRGRRGGPRRPAPRQRVAMSNNRVATRTLRATTRVFLQFDDAQQGGVERSFGFSNSIGEYIGSDYIADNFEQYRVSRVKVLMKPSSAALNNGLQPANVGESIKFQNSVYSLMNNTEVQSFVDYDSDLAPTYTNCLTRPNLRMRALAPNNWTMIASYAPKTLSNPSNTSGVPSITFGNSTWMTTKNMSVTLRGLRGRVSNRSPVFDTQTNVACVDVMFAATVHMRGFKNTSEVTVPISDLEFFSNNPLIPEPVPRLITNPALPSPVPQQTDKLLNHIILGTNLPMETLSEEEESGSESLTDYQTTN